MLRYIYLLAVASVAVAIVSAAPVPKNTLPALGKTNANTLIKDHKDKLAIDASSDWQGWPVANAFDSNEETSWFSASGETATNGKEPWVRVRFPDNVSIRRVNILGNRDPQYPNGYSATAGKIEYLDADNKVLAKEDLVAKGDKHDFEHTPKAAIGGVRAIRFTITKDEANAGCVALSEITVE